MPVNAFVCGSQVVSRPCQFSAWCSWGVGGIRLRFSIVLSGANVLVSRLCLTSTPTSAQPRSVFCYCGLKQTFLVLLTTQSTLDYTPHLTIHSYSALFDQLYLSASTANLESPINLICMSLDRVRQPESTEESHTGSQRRCKPCTGSQHRTKCTIGRQVPDVHLVTVALVHTSCLFLWYTNKHTQTQIYTSSLHRGAYRVLLAYWPNWSFV